MFQKTTKNEQSTSGGAVELAALVGKIRDGLEGRPKTALKALEQLQTAAVGVEESLFQPLVDLVIKEAYPPGEDRLTKLPDIRKKAAVALSEFGVRAADALVTHAQQTNTSVTALALNGLAVLCMACDEVKIGRSNVLNALVRQYEGNTDIIVASGASALKKALAGG